MSWCIKNKIIIYFLIQPRDAISLRLKYEGIKKLLRKSKCEIFKTRGGPYTNDYTNFSEFEKQLFDSDATEYNNGDACKF